MLQVNSSCEGCRHLEDVPMFHDDLDGDQDVLNHSKYILLLPWIPKNIGYLRLDN